MKKKLYITIVVLLAVLALLLMIAWRVREDQPSATESPSTQGSSSATSGSTGSSTVTEPTITTPPTTPPTTQPPTTTPPTTTPPTTQPPTTTPPTTQPPTTQPTNPPDDILSQYGNLYTREFLESLSNKGIPFGPGVASDGNRPDYAVWDQQKHEKYGFNAIAPDNGNIYLTFDCGYEYTATDENGNKYRVTEKILDVLKEKNVKAVFFVTMPYLKSQPDLVQRMIDEGHQVGNHTNNHPVMPTLSIDEMVYEVMSLHEYVLEHFGYEMHLFRFPTGEYSVRALAVLQHLGYKDVHWSFAYGDYTPSNQPSLEDGWRITTSRHHSGAIYLLHAVSETNAAILGDLIDFFRTEGYNLELFD